MTTLKIGLAFDQILQSVHPSGLRLVTKCFIVDQGIDQDGDLTDNCTKVLAVLFSSCIRTRFARKGIRESVSVIHSNLFLVIKRFPDHRRALHRLYVSGESFQSLCDSYQQCSEAVRYWTDSNDESAPDRHREYGKLLLDLEMEILRCCSEDQGGEH